MKKKISFLDLCWLNEPNDKIVKEKSVLISTDPYTDLWNQTYIVKSLNNLTIMYFEY